MKRIYALLLTLALVFCLFGCGAKEDLSGTWQTELDITSLLEGEDGLGAAFGLDEDITMSTSAVLTAELVLASDKTYTMGFNKEASKSSLDAYFNEMIDQIVEVCYRTAEESGVTREQLDEGYGGDFRAYAEESLSGMIDFDQMLDNNERGVWKVENGKLYLAESEDSFDENSAISYTLNGSSLTFDMAENDPFDLKDTGFVSDELVFQKQ